MRNMNNLQKTIISSLKELGAEFGISETDLRTVVRKRMADIKAGHEAKKQQRVP